MKLIHIVCEGKTEVSFVSQVLQPHFEELNTQRANYDRSIQLIPHSLGTGTNFYKIINLAKDLYNNNPNAWVTTMTDFCDTDRDFPGFEDSQNLNGSKKVAYMEARLLQEFKQQIGSRYTEGRFIPNYQLYEFEALLFARPQELANHLGNQYDFINIQEFENTRDQFDSPEHINSKREFSPSARIGKIASINGTEARTVYNKVVDGIAIAKKIGLAQMRSACPHFNEWVTKIESI